MQMNHRTSYPSELNVFIDKRILFKVEVSDANLYRNWRSFTVKKLTMDDDIINRFLTLHGLNVWPNYCYYLIIKNLKVSMFISIISTDKIIAGE
jgi:hypothetical protein